MRSFLRAAGLLLSGLASTFLFLAVLRASHDMPMAIVSGMVPGAAQIVWLQLRGRRVKTMQWPSLGLVLGSGGVALMTGDARIVMLKPSLIYLSHRRRGARPAQDAGGGEVSFRRWIRRILSSARLASIEPESSRVPTSSAIRHATTGLSGKGSTVSDRCALCERQLAVAVEASFHGRLRVVLSNAPTPRMRYAAYAP